VKRELPRHAAPLDPGAAGGAIIAAE